MNVTAQNTTYPINMFDSSGTQELRQNNDSQALVPATEANEKTVNDQKSQDSSNKGMSQQSKAPVSNKSENEATKAEEEAEIKMVEQLKARDREVRAHELAHARVGGQYAGAPTYEYQYGPDGRSYAVGGEVQIDISREPSPEKTLKKMEQVIASAMAPKEPSAQDVRVANQARQIATEARAELNAERAATNDTTENSDGSSKPTPQAAVVSAGSASETQSVASKYSNIQIDVGGQLSQQI